MTFRPSTVVFSLTNLQLSAKSASYAVDNIGASTSEVISDLNGSLRSRLVIGLK